jgi:hypothetical protein
MAGNSEEGQGPQRAVAPMMMMMVIIITMALQLFVGYWPLFQFLDPIHSQ